MTGKRAAGTNGLDPVSFELERFELAGDERIEVSGRWFGVRGRRFVRPSLTVSADGATRRSLAVLEHKPWAPSEGERWIAAFPWEAGAADELVDAELAVAPDIAVALPALTADAVPNGRRISAAAAPDGTSARTKGRRAPAQGANGRRPPAPGANATPAKRSTATPAKRSTATPAKRSNAGAELAALRDERDGLSRALEKARAEALRLQGELDSARAAKVEATAALARRDAVLEKLDEVTAERDAARAERTAAVGERDAIAAERERLRAERDGAFAARDEAFAAREALRQREREAVETEVEARLAELRQEVERERQGASRMAQALRERDAARAACEAALRDRDLAREERDAAREERDAAVRQRNQLLAQRDTARHQGADLNKRLEFALARAARSDERRDAAVAERDRVARDLDAALNAAGRKRAAVAHARRVVTGDARQDQRVDWPLRLRALSPLLVFVIILIVLLRTA